MDYIGMAMKLGSELLEKFPDYDQRKKSKYHKMIKDYRTEVNRPADMADHDLILNLRRDIHDFLDTFYKEIKQ